VCWLTKRRELIESCVWWHGSPLRQITAKLQQTLIVPVDMDMQKSVWLTVDKSMWTLLLAANRVNVLICPSQAVAFSMAPRQTQVTRPS